MIIKNHFHKKGFALGLVLKQRLAASRKWPIDIDCYLLSVSSVGFDGINRELQMKPNFQTQQSPAILNLKV